MNYFNPQPTTPDASTHNYTVTVSDKLSVFGGLWENTISMTKFDARVWAKGPLDFFLQPQGNTGNYFAQQVALPRPDNGFRIATHDEGTHGTVVDGQLHVVPVATLVGEQMKKSKAGKSVPIKGAKV